MQKEGNKMKNQTIEINAIAEKNTANLFDENFKVDVKTGVLPTPADELDGENLDIFTKQYLDKLKSVPKKYLSKKGYKKLMKINIIIFVGYLYQVKDRLNGDLLREVDLFIDQYWKYLINYKDIVRILDYSNIRIGGVVVYLCEGGPSRPFDSDISHPKGNKIAALFEWYSSLFFKKGLDRISGFRYLKNSFLSPNCDRIKDALKYLN